MSSRGRDLVETFQNCRCVLVLTHDNPDPDGLASGSVLRYVLERSIDGLEATVGFSGLIGRAENRAMIKNLGLEVQPLSTLDMESFDGVALVDTQPGSGNNSWAASMPLRAVIDHHPARPESVGAAFVDIRESYGATATIAAEYASGLGIDLPAPLATALFYAIRSETQDLGRDTQKPDRDAYFALLPDADMGAVARIQRARVPREYFDAFHQAIERAVIYGSVVMTDLGPVAAPDMVAEIADFLLRLQGTDWSCCLGRHHNLLAVSIRTTDPFAHAGSLIRRAVAGLGTAGGHGSMAGGQLPVTDESYESVATELQRRILEAIGVPEDTEADPLVRA